MRSENAPITWVLQLFISSGHVFTWECDSLLKKVQEQVLGI